MRTGHQKARTADDEWSVNSGKFRCVIDADERRCNQGSTPSYFHRALERAGLLEQMYRRFCGGVDRRVLGITTAGWF